MWQVAGAGASHSRLAILPNDGFGGFRLARSHEHERGSKMVTNHEQSDELTKNRFDFRGSHLLTSPADASVCRYYLQVIP